MTISQTTEHVLFMCAKQTCVTENRYPVVMCAPASPASCGGQSTALQELNASGNRLQALPASVAGLAGLQCLLVSRNALGSLPAGIGAMPALTQLHAEHNRLTELPPFAQQAPLADLRVGGNLLDSMPEWLGALTGELAGMEPRAQSAVNRAGCLRCTAM